MIAALALTGAAPPDARTAAAARAAMAKTGAKGLAIAVVDRGRVVSAQAFGARNAAGDPLTTRSIMYGASITKTVFAWLVLQLADEGKVDLDHPIADLAKFAAALARGYGLKPRTRAMMTAPALPIRTASQFPTLLPDAARPGAC